MDGIDRANSDLFARKPLAFSKAPSLLENILQSDERTRAPEQRAAAAHPSNNGARAAIAPDLRTKACEGRRGVEEKRAA
jgi:hypothetical protein